METRISKDARREVEYFYIETQWSLSRYAYGITGGDLHLTEDVMQETYRAAALKWEKIRERPRNEQDAWLRRVLKNKVIDHWRTAGRVENYDCIDAATSTPELTHSAALDSIALERCWLAVKGMPRVRQRVAFLRWRADWSIAEIAEHLGIAQATARGHLMAARATLRGEVGPDLSFTDDPEIDETDDGVKP